MKKYLALALIAALAAFAAPAMAAEISSGTEVTVTEDSTWNNSTDNITSITINSGTTLTVNSTAVKGSGAAISGGGTLNAGVTAADVHGVASLNGIAITADNNPGNIQIGAAPIDTRSGSYELTMSNVTTDIRSSKQYVKIAPQVVRSTPTTSTITSAKITLNSADVGHSLFGGHLAIGGSSHTLTVDNSEIVVNGDSAIGRAIYAGGGVWGSNCKLHVETSKITVNGGNFGSTALSDKPTENGFIYGGGLVEANNTTDSASTVGTVEIIINGGSGINGVRGGGRLDTQSSVDAADVLTVEDVSISIVGDAGLNALATGATVTAGGEKVTDRENTGAGDEHELVSGVTSATITVQDAANANSNVAISGEGAETSAVEIKNVQGTLGSVAEVDTVGVDPNTSAALTSVTGKDGAKPEIALVGDWRSASGVQEFDLDEMIQVSGQTADTLFSNADSPVYDPAETGITSLTRNADGSFRATVDRPAGTSGGGGGGCSAGFGALALLAALPLIRMRKK